MEEKNKKQELKEEELDQVTGGSLIDKFVSSMGVQLPS